MHLHESARPLHRIALECELIDGRLDKRHHRRI
jgi:hypothetical protein